MNDEVNLECRRWPRRKYIILYSAIVFYLKFHFARLYNVDCILSCLFVYKDRQSIPKFGIVVGTSNMQLCVVTRLRKRSYRRKQL